jgi:succinyl-CoA synthetase beta subunit
MREIISCGRLARKTFAKMPGVPVEEVPLWIRRRGSRVPRGRERIVEGVLEPGMEV